MFLITNIQILLLKSHSHHQSFTTLSETEKTFFEFLDGEVTFGKMALYYMTNCNREDSYFKTF